MISDIPNPKTAVVIETLMIVLNIILYIMYVIAQKIMDDLDEIIMNITINYR